MDELQVNERILIKVKPNSKWKFGKNKKKCYQPRSYEVIADNGQVYKGNRNNFIKSTSIPVVNDRNSNLCSTNNDEPIDDNLQPETVSSIRTSRKIVRPKRIQN